MIVHDKMKAGLASFMKSRLTARMTCSIGSDLSIPLPIRKSNINRVTTSAVNRLAATPIVSVAPKPLIGPLPMYKITIEEINVVTLDAKIVPNSRAQPADHTPRREYHLAEYHRMRSNM